MPKTAKRILSVICADTQGEAMTLHTIEPQAGTMHGTFSRDYPPVLTIDPGDTVRYRTLEARWALQPPESAENWGTRFSPRTPGRDDGHALCGPVAVRGAHPGMMLAVRIDRLVPGTWGWSLPLYTPERLGLSETDSTPLMRWTLDTQAMTGTNQFGHTVVLRPFMGVMGVAPAQPGIHITAPPRITGGNIDCKELVEGSTLYLPVMVEDALFSVGDGHATQGDGEVSGTALECPMDVCELTFGLRADLPISTPCAQTPTGWLTFGVDEDLNAAAEMALSAMLDLMTARFGMSRVDALSLAGVIVDLHVTQIVNGTRGVHAILPHNALK
jgi:acetamidase/formamidase